MLLTNRNDGKNYKNNPHVFNKQQWVKHCSSCVTPDQRTLARGGQWQTKCLRFHHTCLHFSTWLLSLAESWPVKKVSQGAAVHGSSQQQERWDRDESRRRPLLQLSAGISPRLIPLLVWLQRGHDLQRSQILRVSPVIKQSNMSWVLARWPSPRQFTDKSPDSRCRDASLCIYLSPKSSRGCKMVYKLWPSAVITIRQCGQKKKQKNSHLCCVTCIPAILFSSRFMHLVKIYVSLNVLPPLQPRETTSPCMPQHNLRGLFKFVTWLFVKPLLVCFMTPSDMSNPLNTSH